MSGEDIERCCRDLWEQAVSEQDPLKRRLLIEELFRLIEEQQKTFAPKSSVQAE